MTEDQFRAAFIDLTGNEKGHFPWQWALYREFEKGTFRPCNLPTGLGKTSVIALWLIALAHHPDRMPRRLVYVVNRRTVVDQTTNEVEKLRANLATAGLLESLNRLCALPLGDDDLPLAISTLRGQFADNREWSADPSRPAVICGTVDMIGSRLLFSGYGIGFKSKPLHAGFLGQDVLLVHDEAHLEPAFQKLIEAIRNEQMKEPAPLGEQMRLKVMELTATPRGSEKPFELTDREKSPEELPAKLTEPIHYVWQRLQSKKGITFLKPESDKEKVADRIGKQAKKYSESHPGSAVLVFVNSLEDHAAVCKALKGEQVQVLTGTLRGLERDRMADPRKEDGCRIFARFLKPPKPDDEKEHWKITPIPGTVYLVCTSAGEVGIDISADHMVCDLTAFDRMAQRFGRVNRFGTGDANIDIVHEATPDKKKENDPNEQARWKTLELLNELPQTDERRSASPLALMQLRQREDLKPKFESAYTPQPTILPVSDILFDSWALTTIRVKLPGRPSVEPYLHGKSEWEPPQTMVAWREEVWELRLKFKTEEDRKEREAEERKRLAKFAADLLEDYPIKPHELLRDRSDRVFKHLTAIADRHPEQPAWLLDDEGAIEVFTLKELADKDRNVRINFRTVLLPPAVGGLRDGLLNGDEETANDVADEWPDEKGNRRRVRVWDDDPLFDEKTDKMRLIRPRIVIAASEDDEDAAGRYWHWYVRPAWADDDGSKTAKDPITWQHHTDDVTKNAERIANALFEKDAELYTALMVAAKFHDLGKKRAVWQRSIGHQLPEDPKPEDWLAKSGGKMSPREITDYRHEFGSLLDVQNLDEFKALKDKPELQELIFHLIAVHHGRGRPHFPLDEAFDPNHKMDDAVKIAAEVPRRFARQQRKYGRWGLAYLESLLRAADWAASANPSAFVEEEK